VRLAKTASGGLRHSIRAVRLLRSPFNVIHLTALLAPNASYPNCNLESWGGDMDAPTMVNVSSYHPGGANAAMADGSVRFIKSSTAMQVI
jgi:prepilin-type processing-associated H-X9-DG protein